MSDIFHRAIDSSDPLLSTICFKERERKNEKKNSSEGSNKFFWKYSLSAGSINYLANLNTLNLLSYFDANFGEAISFTAPELCSIIFSYLSSPLSRALSILLFRIYTWPSAKAKSRLLQSIKHIVRNHIINPVF